MTAYEDQMDQNMADAADTAAHTAASGITGAAFTTLPIAELVTMHGSKGLEYDAVFLPCCMEGVVPHKKSKNQAALEEERRMFYVGMTRAKKSCICRIRKERRKRRGLRPGFLLSVGGRSRNGRNETAENCYVRNEKMPSGTFPVWKSSGTAVLLVSFLFV